MPVRPWARRPARFALALVLPIAVAGFAGTAAAQNLVANPHFHDDDLEWEFGPGTDLVWSPAPDESDCPTSGSGIVISEDTGIGHYAVLSQCVALGDPTELHLRLHHRAYGTLTARLDFFTAINCAAGALGGVSDSWSGTPTEWSVASLAADVPGSAGAVRLTVTAIDSAPHGLVVDAVHLTPFESIFLDGFEGSDSEGPSPCRWASP